MNISIASEYKSNTGSHRISIIKRIAFICTSILKQWILGAAAHAHAHSPLATFWMLHCDKWRYGLMPFPTYSINIISLIEFSVTGELLNIPPLNFHFNFAAASASVTRYQHQRVCY